MTVMMQAEKVTTLLSTFGGSAPQGLELRHLRYFVAVAEEQHFARAALRLGITPPTLTSQIKKLEHQLGAKLLKRKGNTRVVVTEAGQRFLADSREVLRHVEQAATSARQVGRGELGRLDIGFNTGVSFAGLLRTWIAEFQRANPAIEATPFIMVTAESKTENVIAAKKAGVNNYIVKPFNAQTLKAKIETVFSEKLQLASPIDN